MTRQLNCGIYIRKSRKDRDKEAHRLEVQREQLPAYASAQGWRATVFDDDVASGADQAKLPLLQELIEQIRRSEMDIVLCIELSRLSRDDSAVQYLQFIDLCRSHGVKLAIPGQILDPADPSQWLILMMQGGLSSVEMQQVKRRMAEGRDRAWRIGQYLGGPPPWPYRPAGNRQIVVTPEDKEKARQILHRLQEASVYVVSQEFDLAPSTLSRMTTRDRLLKYSAKRELDDGTIIDCQWEPIIDESEMLALRKASAGRLPYHRTGREAATRLLTGLGMFMCAYCGKTMKGHTDKKTYRRSGRIETHHYYRCNRYKIRVGEPTECKNQSLIYCHKIDEPLLLHVQHTLDRVTAIRDAYERAVKNDGPKTDVDLERQIAEQERRLARLIDAIADDTMTKEEAKQKLIEVRENIAQLRSRQAREGTPPEQLGVLEEFQGISLADYSLEEKRELLSIVVKDIRLRFDRMFITYNLYEAPGKLYTGRVDICRHPAHNSKLKRQ